MGHTLGHMAGRLRSAPPWMRNPCWSRCQGCRLLQPQRTLSQTSCLQAQLCRESESSKWGDILSCGAASHQKPVAASGRGFVNSKRLWKVEDRKSLVPPTAKQLANHGETVRQQLTTPKWTLKTVHP
jgi:hypothetical protein